MTHFTNTDDVIDSRDIVERIEELEALEGIEDSINALEMTPEATELVTLRELVGEIEQYSGDSCKDGVTLIHSSYFTEYAQELLEDCGEIPKDLPWYISINWDKTAENIRVDYTPVEFDGQTFWVR